MRLPASYIAKRFLSFVVVVWVAASVNFIVPRLAPGDPIGAMVARMELPRRSHRKQRRTHTGIPPEIRLGRQFMGSIR